MTVRVSLASSTIARIGVVGLGVISRFYLAALERRRDAVLRAVADVDPAALAPFRLTAVRTAGDVEALLAMPDVDAVILNVPNDQHAPLCERLIAAGKHVCCEKPLALDPADAERLTAAAAAAGTVLLTAFHRRYNHHLADLHRRLDGRAVRRLHVRYDERIEEHCGADAWYLDPRRCGGGCIADNGPNVFDAAAFLLGDFRLEQGEAWWRGGIDVRARLAGVAAGGAEVVFDLDWAYPRGERKTVAVELDDGARLTVDLLAGFDAFKASLWHEYEGVLDDFLARIAGTRSPAAAGAAPPSGLLAARRVAAAYDLVGPIPVEVSA